MAPRLQLRLCISPSFHLQGSRLRARSRQLATAASDVPQSSQDNLPPPPPTADLSSPQSPDLAAEIASFDPVARSRARTTPLPPSRYRFRPPRFYRGPLHPHQPPPPSDPASRLFVPGPFSLPRLQQTYSSTLASDLMTLFYEHVPYGTPHVPKPPRLRAWDDSSPYYKNRPLRRPRGVPHLGLLRKPITFRNIPKLSGITVSSIVKKAAESSADLHVAGMVLQVITGSRAVVNIAKRSSSAGQRAGFTQKQGKPIAVTITMQGEQMWHFLSTMVSIVLPRIKDWKGMKGSSGDENGNLQLGLTPESVGAWPELAINYDAYPSEKIPGVDIIFHTTAADDRDARLLISSLGLPFDGMHRTS